MIERSSEPQKHDRLAAFLRAYGLRAYPCDHWCDANLLIVDAEGTGAPTHLIYRPQAVATSSEAMEILAAAVIDFSESMNPLVGALPEELRFDLASEPPLQGLSALIVSETCDRRCGGGTVHARLCEVVVVLAIRRALASGTVNAGLLAGLAHNDLHASLVAMHEDPARRWQIKDLAAIAAMSRSRFIDAFKHTIGQPPAAYLTSWRLALGRVELRSGRSAKVAAALVGFGSAAAFSRAYLRQYGYPPSQECRNV